MGIPSESNQQRFKFKWCGNGYKIYPVDGEGVNKVLTLRSVDGFQKIVLEKDENRLNQVWEVLTHYLNDSNNARKNLIFRNKSLDYSNQVGKPLYLSYSSNKLTASIEHESDTQFVLYSYDNNWIRHRYI